MSAFKQAHHFRKQGGNQLGRKNKLTIGFQVAFVNIFWHLWFHDVQLKGKWWDSEWPVTAKPQAASILSNTPAPSENSLTVNVHSACILTHQMSDSIYSTDHYLQSHYLFSLWQRF